jgi:Zn finger protein HypA/HybF involved in hydrogenase expression
MAQPAYQDSNEYCPNCGHYHQSLVDEIGWCPQCTSIEFPDKIICTTCGSLFPKSHHNSKCGKCRKEDFYRENADRLEGYLVAGFSLTAAIEAVRKENRRKCQKCGDELHGGRHGYFCTKRVECRRAYNSYKTLRSSGLSPDVALAIAIGRVTILSN